MIYTGLRQTPEAVCRIALEEDVDVIGISSLATDHRIVPKLMRALADAELDGVAVIVGGIVPDAEEAMLLDAGVARVFHPGTPLDAIAAYIRSIVPALREARGHALEDQR